MTRLELVKNLHAVSRQRSIPPSHALALILIGGCKQGLSRYEFLRDSGLSETATRRVLDHLVSKNLATRYKGQATPPSNIPPYLYQLTTTGEKLVKDLLSYPN